MDDLMGAGATSGCRPNGGEGCSNQPGRGDSLESKDWPANIVLATLTGAAAGASAFLMMNGRDKWPYAAAFVAAEGVSVGVPAIFKATLDCPRPDGSNNKGCISGHTALTLSAASYLMTLSALSERQLTPQLVLTGTLSAVGAVFVAEQRIETGRHKLWRDVVPGAAVGLVVGVGSALAADQLSEDPLGGNDSTAVGGGALVGGAVGLVTALVLRDILLPDSDVSFLPTPNGGVIVGGSF